MDGLLQDHRPQARLDRVGEHQVDLTAQDLLEEQLDVHVGVEGLGLKLDQEVDSMAAERVGRSSSSRWRKCRA